LTLRGVEIVLPQPTRARQIELSVSRNDVYDVVLMNDGSVVATRSIDQSMTRDGGLRTHTVDVPADLEFDVIRVLPKGGDSVYRLGHLRISS
jgi:hypothetical protein